MGELACCVFCERPFVQRTGPGRRRLYCGTRCRRKAQQRRDRLAAALREAALPPPAVAGERLHQRVAELVDGAEQGLPLDRLLALVGRLDGAAEGFVGTVLHQRSASGENWDALAAPAGLSGAAALRRWSRPRVGLLLAHDEGLSGERVPLLRAGTSRAEGPDTSPPTAALERALRALATTAEPTLADAVLRESAAMQGAPSWAAVSAWVSLLGGRPQDVRLLWEEAVQAAPYPWGPVAAAAGRLAAALRGLRLAAGRPSLAVLESRTGLAAETVQAVLDGVHVPDWPGVAALATALGAAPLRLRPAWDTVRMSFSAAPDHFPAGGISLGDPAPAGRAARQ
ncbi:hypothetical protein ACFXKR_19740 [Streptomyces violascens]|uniref:hypothetical protein n=1 Tax=Streptomyces violascens TaxID=67381 RepID=UPI00368016E6